MKALTLTEYIDKQLKTDAEFAEHHAREQIVNAVAEAMVKDRVMTDRQK